MIELDVHSLPQTVENYLHQQGWITPENQVLELEKPGEGNMNVVVRVKLKQGSLILKQGRPYVQKYPQIPAPLERVEVESRFYELAQQNDALNTYLPEVIGFDPEQYVIALEDLGESADYTFMYQKSRSVDVTEMEAAVRFLYQLHQTAFTAEAIRHFPKNLALRKLNHEHLFIFPYMPDNGFDLDTVQQGLQGVSMTYKTDGSLKKEIGRLGDLYLSSGPTLLHGDYYPGSWLRVKEHFQVIDPEFCYFGHAEYDFGVMLAHFKMARLQEGTIGQARSHYLPADGFNNRLATQFAGMEILRRIIGLAQLPLDLSLSERSSLLREASAMVKG